jgi:hypothetical protein
MATDENTTSEADAEAIKRIVFAYAKQATKSPEEAQNFINKLGTIVSQDSAKLVHFGGTLFLILVRGKGAVEIHTMSVNEDSLSLAKNFVALSKYLKQIGVRLAYTYTDDPKFKLIARRTKLPIKNQKLTLPDGQEVTAYYLEL